MLALRLASVATAASLLFITGAVRGQDQESPGSLPQGSPVLIGHRYTLQSQVLHEERPIFIGLPEKYGASQAAYPVLYVLDGDEERFLGVMGVARTLASQDRMPATIVVAIPSTDRNHDLTPPTQDPANAPAGAGGADTFLKFLRDELIPYVEARYRTTPHRTVIGVSFGGLFAIHALYTRPDTFDTCLAISPSLWWNRGAPIASLKAFLSKTQVPARRLVFTIADEPAQMRTPIDQLREMLSAAAPPQFHWDFLEIPAETHDTSALPATWSGLRSAFADWPISDEVENEGLPGLREAYRRRAATYGISPDVPASGYFQFGYRLLGDGKPEQALEALQLSAKLDPGYAYAAAGLGMTYEQLGRLDDAVRSMQKAVELTKTRDQELASLARRELKRLRQLQSEAQH